MNIINHLNQNMTQEAPIILDDGSILIPYDSAPQYQEDYGYVITESHTGSYPTPVQIQAQRPQRFVDYVANAQLSHCQNKAVKLLDEFIFSNTQHVMILRGHAGTGKTFLTRALVGYLTNHGINVNLMAPTGKAAGVLGDAAGILAATVHRGIFSFDDDEAIQQYLNIPYIQSLKYSSNNTFIICDEASMLSDAPMFGKNFEDNLLESLIKHANLGSSGNKLLLIGDHAQLPPVRREITYALNPDHIGRKYGLYCSVAELRDIKRQGAHSGILYLANMFRQEYESRGRATASSIYKKLLREYNFYDVHEANLDALRVYMKYNPTPSHDNAVVITHTNKAAAKYNHKIRECYFAEEQLQQLCLGDKILVTKNSYNEETDVFNGEIGNVLQIYSEPLVYTVQMNGRNNFIDLHFHDVLLEFKMGNNTTKKIRKHIFSTPLFCKSELQEKQVLEAYEDLKKMIINDYSSPERKEMAKRNSPIVNALQVKFGYAITCHKSQGSSWEAVILDTQALTKDLRWHYTAVTRAEKKLYLVGV